MYPYEARVRWFVRGPARHLCDAVRGQPELLEGEKGRVLRNRVQQTEWWAFVRTSLLIPLSATLIVAAYNWVSQNLTSTAAADEAISLFARVSNTFAILFAVLYLLVNRMVNQLQMDLLSLLSFQAAEKAIPQHME